ncbi:hypothetical protein CGCS363_v011661 [Colletotrichum siamense]|uniref:uncharacterized protein n=1 Tax=Colletotrichum siamense TaxID=690259 RepID=UPI001872208C|nr:uncharacterized protein CGCS363_v011661 [Colletotrichum siamense]KAF5489071.1 hypothetical protein CGCS363_v011661 [Colletotrichum siamense]
MGFPPSSSPATRQMRFIAPVSPLSSSPASHGTHCAQKDFWYVHSISRTRCPKY